MAAGVLISFVVVFALVLCAVSVAMKFFEAKRKSQVTGMLNTASGQPQDSISNLLRDADPEKATGFKAVLGSFSLSSKARVRLSEAGHDMDGRADWWARWRWRPSPGSFWERCFPCC